MSEDRKISKAWAGNRREPIPIPLKTVIPAIPKKDEELQAQAEDLRVMVYEGLLAKPWNLRAKDTLRDFRF